MSGEKRRKFWDLIRSAGDDKYQPAEGSSVMEVQTVLRDSNGGIVSVVGSIDGHGEFIVPMKGHQAAVNDHIMVSYPTNRPVGSDLEYVRHIYSDHPAPGMISVDANLPSPTFHSSPWITELIKLPGSITASGTVYFNAVEARFYPTFYTVSFRFNGGAWRDRQVPHTGGLQQCNLGNDIPPSADVDVHLRTFYSHSTSESVPTATTTFEAAADDSSPGGVTGITVSENRTEVLHIRLTVATDSDLLLGYIYQLSTDGAGSPDLMTVPLPATVTLAVPPGNWYIAAYPISKSGTAGAKYPPGAGTYQGPYTVTAMPGGDTTPPEVPGAPAVQGIVWIGSDYVPRGKLRITLDPVYDRPPDFSHFVITLNHLDTGLVTQYAVDGEA